MPYFRVGSNRREAELVGRALQLLAGVRRTPPSGSDVGARSLELATLLLEISSLERTGDEHARARQFARMMNDHDGRAFTQALTDRIHRPRSASKVIDEIRDLLGRYGAPRYLGPSTRVQLSLVPLVGALAPDWTVRTITRRIRSETSPYIIAGEPDGLTRHLAARHAAGLRVNVNRLGEAVVGEAEALHHVDGYVELLRRADVETISVKISSLFSQVSLLAWSATLDTLRRRLRRIYRAAKAARPSPTASKLVYLDMEAYRDLYLSFELFRSVLDEPEFLDLTAGLVLQAYVPESARLQRELCAFAEERARRGGAPLRLRIVKGANLALERVESSLRGWALPTFSTKLETDANYKRMLEFGTDRRNAEVVRLGIASHNLFDLAYGLVLRAARGVEEYVGFELLEGMAGPICRALRRIADDILLYGPMVTDAEFTNAIAYLTRRLDENTSVENFLPTSFDLQVGSAAFEREERKFLAACARVGDVSDAPKRDQNRRQAPASAIGSWPRNEPDTDFSHVANREWIFQELERWHARVVDLPLHIGGEEIYREPLASGFDPSRPGHVPYRHSVATSADLDRALSTAVHAGTAWSKTSPRTRAEHLRNAARDLRLARAELVACMVLDAGKRIEEADVEVSEAIDFAEYYAHSLVELSEYEHVEPAPRGVTVVTPPWNFPLAIPLSGVFAALAGGNSVILKPALETVLVADRAARVLWGVGIPKAALQLVIAEDEVASKLLTDPRTRAVVLTGATTTARRFRSLRPDLFLCAETGGKNALIITAHADRELAIRDLLASAFGHAGQKCSAASLLILEAEVYDDASFARKLHDAAESLAVGSAWDPKSYVTPLIRAPEGALLRALSSLDGDERWLLEPVRDASNPRLYGPGIKYGVAAGSTSHMTEFFGPLLSVLRAADLSDAVRIANATPYGLTAGIHSLSEREQRYFLEHMNAGNLYVNRTITGAIVGRQPFGGRKASCFGPGAKAGGPNYVAQLMSLNNRNPYPKLANDFSIDLQLRELAARLEPRLSPQDAEALHVVIQNYTEAYQSRFALEHDAYGLLGQDNIFLYRPCRVLLRTERQATDLELACSLIAARVCGAARDTRLHLSVAEGSEGLAALCQGSDDLIAAPSGIPALVDYLRERAIDRVRVLGHPPEDLFRLTANDTVHIATEPVLFEGRFELLHYLREQSRSINTHRYGNLTTSSHLVLNA